MVDQLVCRAPRTRPAQVWPLPRQIGWSGVAQFIYALKKNSLVRPTSKFKSKGCRCVRIGYGFGFFLLVWGGLLPTIATQCHEGGLALHRSSFFFMQSTHSSLSRSKHFLTCTTLLFYILMIVQLFLIWYCQATSSYAAACCFASSLLLFDVEEHNNDWWLLFHQKKIWKAIASMFYY